jgi:hypothetical protein
MTKSIQNPVSSEHEKADSLLGGYLTTEATFKKGFISIGTSGRFKKEEVSMLSEFGSEFDTSVSSYGAIIEAEKTPEIYGYIDKKIKTAQVLPELNTSAIENEINKYTGYLESPYQADTELFSPQLFYDENDLPAKEMIFVNDAVFIRDGTFNYPRTIISTSDIIVENAL